MATRYDVLIIGGGVAGCSAALALRAQGVASVAILHKPDEGPLRTGEALHPRARDLMQRLGLLDDFAQVPHLNSHGVASAWGGPEIVYNDNLFRLHGHGHLLDRAAFDRCCMEKVKREGIAIIEGAFAGQYQEGSGKWCIRVSGGAELQARFIIDATGRRAAFARSLSVPRIRFDELQAVCTLWKGRPQRFPQHTLIESLEQGWCYAAALPDDRFVVVAFVDKQVLKQRRLKYLKGFLAFVEQTQYIAPMLHGTPQFLASSVAMADSSILETSGSEAGWLAVGDAASAYDPLSSVGIAKAMDSGLRSARAIRQWLDGLPSAIAAHCRDEQQAFEQYLQQRCHYYAQETRWPQQPFWKSRQQWLGLHPQRRLETRDIGNARLPDRVLNASQLTRLKAICQGLSLPAHEVVRRYQAQSSRGHADWRVIQALRFLIESGHLVESDMKSPPAPTPAFLVSAESISA